METARAVKSASSRLLAELGVLAITLTYLWFEVRYNRGLLDLFNNAEINQSAIDDLSVEGKVLASLGLVWAILRGLIARIPTRLAQVAVFALASGVTYAGLSVAYDHVIRNLSRETKADGFRLAAYRQALIEGNVSDPDVPLPAKFGAVGSVFMLSIPLVLFDDRYMVPARAILELKAKMFEDYYWKKVDSGWIKYDRQMRTLRTGYQQYIDGSRRVEAAPMMFRARARDQFNRESGGMTPNSRASMDAFLSELSRSSTPAASEYRAAQQEIIFVEREGTPHARHVRGTDLPMFMNRDQFRRSFAEKIDAAMNEVLPTPETVEKTARIHDINSSVFLPPMAMATSLLSILANAAAAVWIIVTLPMLMIPNFATSSFPRISHLLAPCFVIVVIVLAIVLSPRFVFPDMTPMRELERKMHQRMGFAGEIWSRAAAFQVWVYRRTTFVQRGVK